MTSSETIDREGRKTWSGRFDFLMTLVGSSVGTANLWRFPYLCYKNGGGVFLIPYFIALLGIGIPIFLLQVALGQFMSLTGPNAWNIYPLAKGLGFITMVMTAYLALYYVVVIAWAIYYIYAAVANSPMPWTVCDESYGSKCYDRSLIAKNVSSLDSSMKEPAELFWTKGALNLSESMESIGTIQPHMALSLLVAWIIVYLCIIRGIRWTGKIVWFTGLFPYVMLLVLFIRGVTLPGASKGIMYYLQPDFSKLLEGQVWLDAGTQIMYSMSLGEGNIITLASYNHFHVNSLRDAIIFSAVNCLTSFFGGFCIFATLGYMAHERDIPISEVSDGGPGLTFIAYPTALSLIPYGAKVFTVCFFLMILFLGMDSQFVFLEGLSCQILDTFPRHFNFRFARAILISCLCTLFYCIGLIFTTNAGMYYFQIFDFYSVSGAALLFLCFGQCFTIAYLYGGRRFLNDVESMFPLGIVRPYLMVSWYIATPILCVAIAILYWATYKPLTYGQYTYPGWSVALGCLLAVPTIFAVPLAGILELFKHRNQIGQVKIAVLKKHQIHHKSEQPYSIAQAEVHHKESSNMSEKMHQDYMMSTDENPAVEMVSKC